MNFPPSIRGLLACFFALVSVRQTPAYNLLGPAWPADAKVVMQLGLGPTTISLQDGSSSWNASAADALDIWNGYLDFITLSSISSPTVPEVSGDGVSSVFYSSTIFGDSFGEGTLAVTVLLSTESQTTVTAEGDVIVNSAFRYDSYRGPQQSDAGGPIYDFHRIVLHEFGHVLGLDHIELIPPGQALMEPIISDLDHLAVDDIGGVRFLYGAEISNVPASGYARVGDPYIFNLLSANNNPTSYSGIGLPAGLTIDAMSGDISGTTTTTGVYNVVITAHGPIADAYAAFQLTVRDLEEVLGLQAIVRLDAVSLLSDPIRPRIYTAGINGINMIDTETLKVTKLLSGDERPAQLSLSADSSCLLFTKTGTPTEVERIDLNSLAVLPALPIPGDFSPVLEGLDGRDYVTGLGGVLQFDATTGALQQSFGPTYPGVIAISPDRRTLFVTAQPEPGELSTYDISTPDPLLMHQLTGSFLQLTPSPEGQYLYYFLTSSNESVQAGLPELSPRKSFAFNPGFSFISVGLDGAIYVSNVGYYDAGSISVYDPVSLKLTWDIDLSHLEPFIGYQPSRTVFDQSGGRFFACVSGIGTSEVWVFSTDLASSPPPPVHLTKNLLNISTRARVETGEDAMIAGFIVQGPDPKKVLIRGLGPSLPLTGAISNPVLDLYDSSGKLLASNDDWISERLSVIGTQVAPSSERESAMLVTVQPGAYTAIVRDLDNQPGLALVEVYDLDPSASLLANISTRGKVETADNVMIGGFIVGGADPGPADSATVLIRAIGPSLSSQGVQQPLADPTLELYDGWGELVSSNDNWRLTQEADIIATGIPPTDDREAAILTTLLWGSYTAIVRAGNDTTGIALVEIYNLDSTAGK